MVVVGWPGEGGLHVRSDSDCCWDVKSEAEETHRNVKTVGAFEVEGTLGTADSNAATVSSNSSTFLIT